jgi:hypothetical protein
MPIIENRLTGRLCRFIEFEMFPGVKRVWMEDLLTGIKTVATERFVEPYRGAVIVDFERRV